MSWSIRRPNVTLRVAKFAPEGKPLDIQSPQMRDALDAHKERRAKEQTKAEPATELYEVRKPYNQWLYGSFVELEQIGPLETGPLEPVHRCNDFYCMACQNKGVQYGDYLKNKAVRERNGFG